MSEELSQRTEEIHAALDAFSAALTPAAPADHLAFSRLRVRLAAAIKNYIFVESDEVLGPLRARQDEALKPMLDAVQAETTILRLAYSEHIQKWPNQALMAGWPIYRKESAVLVERLLVFTRLRASIEYRTAKQLVTE